MKADVLYSEAMPSGCHSHTNVYFINHLLWALKHCKPWSKLANTLIDLYFIVNEVKKILYSESKYICAPQFNKGGLSVLLSELFCQGSSNLPDGPGTPHQSISVVGPRSRMKNLLRHFVRPSSNFCTGQRVSKTRSLAQVTLNALCCRNGAICWKSKKITWSANNWPFFRLGNFAYPPVIFTWVKYC